jgi:hypothetical protein
VTPGRAGPPASITRVTETAGTRPDLDAAPGVLLALEDYYRAWQDDFARCRTFWKLERGQHFAEPGDPSWEAFAAGDWDEAMRLLEARRPALAAYHASLTAGGTVTRRVRVVSLPPTPYLQWELNLLRARDEAGGHVRVTAASEAAAWEADGPLPEVCVMDSTAAYQSVYDANGVLHHAVRYADPEVAARWRAFTAALWQAAEPLAGFFRREIAGLPPARPGRPPLPPDYLARTGRPGPIRS